MLKFDAIPGASQGADDGTIKVVWNGAVVATMETGADWQTFSVEVTGTDANDRMKGGCICGRLFYLDCVSTNQD